MISQCCINSATMRSSSHYEVVERKTAEELAAFCSHHSIDVKSSWMIGDSVRSDIIPARAIGLGAIHFQSPNWVAEAQMLPAGVVAINNIADAIPIIRSSIGCLQKKR